MDIVWKAIGGALVTAIFGLVIGKRTPDISAVLSMGVCCMLLVAAISIIRPVVEFIRQLGALTELDGEVFGILMKSVALSLVSRLASMLCTDAGNSALGKGIEILTLCAVLWISIPLFSGLIELISSILGQI